MLTKTKLSDVIKLSSGKSIKPGGVGKYPVYGSNGKIGGSDDYRYENAIIIGRVGAYCGSIEYSEGKFWASDNTLVAQPTSNAYDIKYLSYLLRTLNLRRYAGGSAQPLMTQSVIKSIEADIPATESQVKIGKMLSAYDDLIENNSKRIEKLEAMARLLYRHYFEVPEATDWEELPLSETLLVHRGKSYKGTELSEAQGLPFVNLKCVNRGGGFRKDGLKLFTGSFKDTQRVERGDIVIAVTDMTQERMIVARAARVPSLDSGFGVISMDMVKLEPKEGFVKDYLYAMLRWSRFADEVKNHANGANVLHLLPARITDYSLPMPPQELQEEFADKVSPLFNLIDNLQQKNEALAKARDLLLPRLMSGEITA